uniref:Ovule protein n=1 Tax=Brugia timori TaxID=42155 RepID=A0A0R3QU57_9BILA
LHDGVVGARVTAESLSCYVKEKQSKKISFRQKLHSSFQKSKTYSFHLFIANLYVRYMKISPPIYY